MMLLMVLVVASGFFFAYQGVAMQNTIPREEAKFHALQQKYFIINKAERESAPTGAELNQRLVDIQNYPSSLLELKLVGVGKILTGIFFMLFAILMALVVAMPMRLAKIIKKSREG